MHILSTCNVIFLSKIELLVNRWQRYKYAKDMLSTCVTLFGMIREKQYKHITSPAMQF